MKKIRILVSCPGGGDTTSFYRAFGPMATLEKQFEDIEIVIGGQDVQSYEWQFLRRVDILFSQRPCQPIHQKVIEKAIQNKVPIWIDYDDDLLSVPKDNPTSGIYNTHAATTSVMNCLRLATYVSVSTQKLKDKFTQFNRNIEVIPNALDNTLFKPQEIKEPKDRKKAVLWRGSNTHLADLLTYQKEILEAHRAHPEYTWIFLGYEPWFLTQSMAPGSYWIAPWAGHMEYFDLIQRIAPPIMMAPLMESEFNQAKSNIAWLEGSLAGAAVIAPDWQEWQRPGVINYKDGPHFLECLDRAMSGKIDTEACREKAWQHIESELFLTDVNKLRHNAARRLVA